MQRRGQNCKAHILKNYDYTCVQEWNIERISVALLIDSDYFGMILEDFVWKIYFFLGFFEAIKLFELVLD